MQIFSGMSEIVQYFQISWNRKYLKSVNVDASQMLILLWKGVKMDH